jgi:MFS family permease
MLLAKFQVYLRRQEELLKICPNFFQGYFQMSDFLQRFGQQNPDGTYYFSAYRQGTMTALLCGGAAVGSLIAGRLADVIGRKFCISLSAFWTAIGVINLLPVGLSRVLGLVLFPSLFLCIRESPLLVPFAVFLLLAISYSSPLGYGLLT